MKYKLDIQMWFNEKKDRDEAEMHFKKKLTSIPNFKKRGRFKTHNCYHDETINKPCTGVINSVDGDGGYD